MQGVDLIQDFATLLLAAGVAGVLCKRIGLSVIVGYLLAGVIIGPHTPPFSMIVDEGRIMALSQVGLVFLMFSIGLGLSLTKFGRLGVTTIVGTALGAFFVLNLTRLLGLAVHWPAAQTLFVAAMLMVSSSAVIAKIVSELNLAHERSSQLALGITVLEDVVAVVMLTVLGSQVPRGTGEGMGSLLGGLSAFVVLLIGGGLLLVPRLMRRLEARADPELQTIVVAGVLFLLALAAVKAGYSIALGAFLFGAIVAEMPQKSGVERAFGGLRDVFSSVFFVSIGMMIDPRLVLSAWPWVLGLAAFALVARPIATGLALIIVGTPPREAHRAGLLLTPLGEFSFIIAQVGVAAALLPAEFYSVAVGASILTVFAMPVMNRHRDAIIRFAERVEPGWLLRAMDAYHRWMQQMQERPAPPLAWKLVRGRLGQMAIEGLFVTGVLIFSSPVLASAEDMFLASWQHENVVTYGFWALVTVLVLVPLVAIWRNLATVAMIAGESVGRGHLPAPLVERTIKAVGAVGLAYWLYAIVPLEELPGWGWAVLAAAAALVVAVFSQRLIYWHSTWQNSLQQVLADATNSREQARITLGENLEAWQLHLGECVVPDAASYAGKALRELAIPARFGASVVEVERNGYVVSSPSPDVALYPGDKLLLLGATEQNRAAQKFLESEQRRHGEAEEFGGSVLETCRVPAGPHAGQTLAASGVAMHTGVRVVGIQRPGQQILNPGGDERLLEGDSVLVLGTLSEIKRFRRWLVEG
ncbi:cation:proton antiporter [Horticoccus luteus]|uniref:Cation:proton antiporter n=1 Tax=Horticoccus luteus TaxID=2862869 RepID=A0A8F9XJ96_9BACT|nr:cation:proton antiporter [Horticoccus luteus]QYM78428.1 cation:proton antiporter [Horticoccus luteus]